MTNVIPEGGHYSAQGKLQSLDPAAMTLTLVSDKGGTLPMTIGPEAEADLSDVSVGDVVLYSKYGGTEVKYSGQEYLVLSARDVLAVIEK